MNLQDPNIQLLEIVARALGELRDELIFVGGCAAGLLCTSPSAAPPRVTYDVDVVAEVTTLVGYHALEKRIAARGFKRDASPDAPVCRWRLDKVMVDLMPSEERVLGFANRWYPLAVAHCNTSNFTQWRADTPDCSARFSCHQVRSIFQPWRRRHDVES